MHDITSDITIITLNYKFSMQQKITMCSEIQNILYTKHKHRSAFFKITNKI